MQTDTVSKTHNGTDRPILRLRPTASQPSQANQTVQLDEELDVLSMFKEERRMNPKQRRPRKSGTGLYRCHSARNKRND
ncbi:hypothetical protein AB6D11_06395 [Vibrio splendidus]